VPISTYMHININMYIFILFVVILVLVNLNAYCGEEWEGGIGLYMRFVARPVIKDYMLTVHSSSPFFLFRHIVQHR
jgi:hypothetical protein